FLFHRLLDAAFVYSLLSLLNRGPHGIVTSHDRQLVSVLQGENLQWPETTAAHCCYRSAFYHRGRSHENGPTRRGAGIGQATSIPCAMARYGFARRIQVCVPSS